MLLNDDDVKTQHELSLMTPTQLRQYHARRQGRQVSTSGAGNEAPSSKAPPENTPSQPPATQVAPPPPVDSNRGGDGPESTGSTANYGKDSKDRVANAAMSAAVEGIPGVTPGFGSAVTGAATRGLASLGVPGHLAKLGLSPHTAGYATVGLGAWAAYSLINKIVQGIRRSRSEGRQARDDISDISLSDEKHNEELAKKPHPLELNMFNPKTGKAPNTPFSNPFSDIDISNPNSYGGGGDNAFGKGHDPSDLGDIGNLDGSKDDDPFGGFGGDLSDPSDDDNDDNDDNDGGGGGGGGGGGNGPNGNDVGPGNGADK